MKSEDAAELIEAPLEEEKVGGDAGDPGWLRAGVSGVDETEVRGGGRGRMTVDTPSSRFDRMQGIEELAG